MHRLLSRVSSLGLGRVRWNSGIAPVATGVKVGPELGFPAKDPEFDVCVIGAGPAGYAAAMRAWDFGKRVCIIEAGKLGGTAVHNGALTSKTMWEISRDYRHSLRKDRGFVADRVHIDYRQMVDCVDQAVSEKVSQLLRQLQELSHPQPNRAGRITYLHGRAEFVDPYRVQVLSESGVDRTVSAHNFVIATGSQPRRIPSIEVDGEFIMTSDHIMHMNHFPRR
jgi:dihydrolipoamide dehydrogenase